MVSIKDSYKKNSGKIMSSLVTLLVLTLLIWVGPATALNISLGDTNPSEGKNQGEIIYVDATVNFIVQGSNEGIVLINGEPYCGFNLIDGSKISGCNGMNIQVKNDNISLGNYSYGYGYGYGYSYGDGTINYNISIDTSFFSKGIHTVSLKINNVQSASRDLNITSPLNVNGTEENADSVTVVSDWKISTSEGNGTSSVFIPSSTIITPSDPTKTINLSQITTDITTAIGLDNIKGVLQFGIPNEGLDFNQAITLQIFVGTSLTGRTLSVYRSTSNSSGWAQEGLVDKTCLVSASGICEFKTLKASYFAANLPIATTSTTTGGTGGYCTTQWTCSEWSTCSNGVQTRTCTYPSNFCAPSTERPLEQVSCVAEDMPVFEGDDSSSNEGFFNLLTGFVIGNLLESPVNMTLAIIILIVIVALLWLVVAKRRAAVKKIKKKTKK